MKLNILKHTLQLGRGPHVPPGGAGGTGVSAGAAQAPGSRRPGPRLSPELRHAYSPPYSVLIMT